MYIHNIYIWGHTGIAVYPPTLPHSCGNSCNTGYCWGAVIFLETGDPDGSAWLGPPVIMWLTNH